jgi:hypothetical protein
MTAGGSNVSSPRTSGTEMGGRHREASRRAAVPGGSRARRLLLDPSVGSQITRKKIMVGGISIGGAAPLGGVGLRQPTQNDAAPFAVLPVDEKNARVGIERYRLRR